MRSWPLRGFRDRAAPNRQRRLPGLEDGPREHENAHTDDVRYECLELVGHGGFPLPHGESISVGFPGRDAFAMPRRAEGETDLNPLILQHVQVKRRRRAVAAVRVFRTRRVAVTGPERNGAFRGSKPAPRSWRRPASFLAVGLARQDVRGVMEHHAPSRACALVDIGHEDGGDGNIALELRQNVLGTGDPGETALCADLDIREREAQLATVLEDGLPGLADALPTGEQTPAGMHAAHVFRVTPHGVHGFEILALDGAIEARIGLLDLGLLLVGCQLVHLPPREPASISIVRRSRAAPGQGPSTQMPVCCSKMAPWVEQMRYRPSSVMNSLGH